MKKIKLHLNKIQPVSIAILLLFLGTLQGCKYYYKVQTVSQVNRHEVKTYDSLDKYIILHQKDKAWHLTKILSTKDMLYGKLSVLPENRYKFLTTKPTGGNRYIKNKESNELYVLDEVHLYVKDSVVPAPYDTGNIKIAFSSIQQAELYVKAKGRTTASWLVPSVGGTELGGGLVAAIVIAVSMSSMHINLSH